MTWHRALALLVAGAGLLLSVAVFASAQSQSPDFAFLEASWCTKPHDDYRRGQDVVEIRQFRDVAVVADPRTNAPLEVTAQQRSALVSTKTRSLDIVGAWIDFKFKLIDARNLHDSSVSVSIAINPDRTKFVYRYADSKPYAFSPCGPAGARLTEKAALPAEVTIPEMPTTSASADLEADAVEPTPKAASVAPTVAAIAEPGPSAVEPAKAAEPQDVVSIADPEKSNPPDSKPDLNRSNCFSMEKTGNGYFGFLNACADDAYFTYCVVKPTTRSGRGYACRGETGEQIGRGTGFAKPGEIQNILIRSEERGTVIWFACAMPGVPALTRANPPSGRCL